MGEPGQEDDSSNESYLTVYSTNPAATNNQIVNDRVFHDCWLIIVCKNAGTRFRSDEILCMDGGIRGKAQATQCYEFARMQGSHLRTFQQEVVSDKDANPPSLFYFNGDEMMRKMIMSRPKLDDNAQSGWNSFPYPLQTVANGTPSDACSSLKRSVYLEPMLTIETLKNDHHEKVTDLCTAIGLNSTHLCLSLSFGNLESGVENTDLLGHNPTYHQTLATCSTGCISQMHEQPSLSDKFTVRTRNCSDFEVSKRMQFTRRQCTGEWSFAAPGWQILFLNPENATGKKDEKAHTKRMICTDDQARS
ncbi:hypothetical protein CLF_101680 [Clonorchis sinensis]|uniref:Uncharacterized protein n=1 Tax=Clonorchis sinensis TaxID=79923 RepID=G7Y6B2_CLOSI|nr:hypothetical protein CLF_101680 [Clonorchis sinensis]